MVLKEVLQKHKIPLPEDYDERMELLVSALRRSPNYNEKLKAFKRRKVGGGADEGEDWLGPKLTGFVDVLTSPAARGVLMSVFAVVFFLKYLEATPLFGSILSATLDLMVMGGKMMVKTVQKVLPPAYGLIPLPYAAMVGLASAALFGMLIWPIIGVVSFSRGDFTAAIESFIRVIPPPMGDSIADLFLEGNRTVARLDEKRVKLMDDLSSAFTMLSETAGSISEQAEEGFQNLSKSIQEVPKPTMPTIPSVTIPTIPKPTLPTMPTIPKPVTAGKRHRFSRRVRKNKKWRTQRSKFVRH